MSRVTPPVTKLFHAARSISSSSQSARSSAILDSPSRYLPRSVRALKAECTSRQLKITGNKSELVDRLTAHDLIRQQSTLIGGHCPNPSLHMPVFKTRPLVQGFNTSAPKQAAHDKSTIDFFFFPEVPEDPPANPFSMRVPLLPDNYNPDRSSHAIESLDEAVPRPEIIVIASHPEHVLPAAMSEVVGNEGIDVSIEDLTKAFNEDKGEAKEQGVVKQIWSGLIDDIFGSQAPKTPH